MDFNLNDGRDEYEVEFDSRFSEEESEEPTGLNDITDDTIGSDITGDSGESEDIELDTDAEDVVGDLRIQNKSYRKTITRSEANEIKAAIEEKTKELEEARIKMQEKKEDGDLSENEAYHYFKDKVYSLEGDIMRLEKELRTSNIADTSGASKSIMKGSIVHLVIEDVAGIMATEDIKAEIVSSGHSGIGSDGTVKVPENSEVYRRMEGKTSGEFTLTGTDGNNYKYRFELVGGA